MDLTELLIITTQHNQHKKFTPGMKLIKSLLENPFIRVFSSIDNIHWFFFGLRDELFSPVKFVGYLRVI